MSTNLENGDVIKVIIADDHVLYRAGVKTALSSKKDMKNNDPHEPPKKQKPQQPQHQKHNPQDPENDLQEAHDD